jgi:hypothetical protein
MALNPKVTPSSQGSGARGTPEGGGPEDSATGAAQDSGVLAPESDPTPKSNSTIDATTTGGAQDQAGGRGVIFPDAIGSSGHITR